MSDTVCTKCGGTKFYTLCKNCEENPYTTISTLKAQRDVLLAAARIASDVLKQERDHTPMTFRIITPSGAIKLLDTAIANAGATPCD